MFKNIHIRHVLSLIILSYFFFIFGNSILPMTNPDEVFYVQSAKEMVNHKSWLVPYLFDQPQFEKPIVTFWFLRIGFILFGISNFGARFFPALFALGGVLALYWLVFKAYDNTRKAFLCALVLASGAFYIGMARTVFTDMIFSVFILFSFCSFYIGYAQKEKKSIGLILAFTFSGLAVLTKGPLGILMPGLSILFFLALKRELRFLCCAATAFGLMIFLALTLPWYGFMIRGFGNSFVHEFFYNDHVRRVLEAEHRKSDTWYFYPSSVLGSFYPWIFFFIAAFFAFLKRVIARHASSVDLFLLCWIGVIFVICQVAHSKLISYVLPLFPALAIIIGDFIDETIKSNKQRSLFALCLLSWIFVVPILIGCVLAPSVFPVYGFSKITMYTWGFVQLIILGVMLAAILKRKFLIAIKMLIFEAPLLIFIAFSTHQNFEDYVASKRAGEYLIKNAESNSAVVCSKFFVRGIRFYTDRDVAVLALGGGGFFSPHPIPYLNSWEKFTDFLKKQSITYAVVTKSSFENLHQLDAKGFSAKLLEKIGSEYIVKIQSKVD